MAKKIDIKISKAGLKELKTKRKLFLFPNITIRVPKARKRKK